MLMHGHVAAFCFQVTKDVFIAGNMTLSMTFLGIKTSSECNAVSWPHIPSGTLHVKFDRPWASGTGSSVLGYMTEG